MVPPIIQTDIKMSFDNRQPFRLALAFKTRTAQRLGLSALFSSTLESINKPLINVDDNVLIASNAPH